MLRRHACALALAIMLPAGHASAQVLGFSDFTWTWVGGPTSSGTVDASLMHVQGPDSGFCTNELAYYEATAPYDGTLRVVLDWTIFDICHYDWPIYVIDGAYTKIEVPIGGGNCFLPGTKEVMFDVSAGQTFGLGVGSSDCFEGPGVADYSQFTFSADSWTPLGGGIDPRDHAHLQPPVAAGSHSEFGSSMLAVGDVDADGRDDVLVGQGFQVGPGIFTLHSGDKGQPLWSVSIYGFALAAPGDVNGDGVPDVAAVGPGSSSVRVLDGTTGFPLWTWIGAATGYGAALAAFGDRDGDGVLDIAVGSFGSYDLPVVLLSGATGQQLGTIPLAQPDETVGTSLAAAGDLDGDGVGDIMVTTLQPTPLVRIRSGLTGAVLLELLPTESFPSVGFGQSLAALGDVDNDGVIDYAVGSTYANLASGDGGPGAVFIYSGATGGVIATHAGPHASAQFGSALDTADVDGDGKLELAVGIRAWHETFGAPVGRVDVIRPLSGQLVSHLEGQAGDAFGQRLAFLDGPGEVLLAVGAPQAQIFTGVPGRAVVFDDLLHVAGRPRFTGLGSLAPNTPWLIRVSHGLPGNLVTLVLGLSELGLPFKGGVLVPSPDALLTFPLDAAGSLILSGTWPAVALPGPLYAQGWMVDADATKGLSATPGLRSPSR